MSTKKECAFCNTTALEDGTIRTDKWFRSIVSIPRFTDDQCLVIPNRHVTTIAELNKEEMGDVMEELGRLSVLLDRGYGTGVMQKYQPLQAENGIKVSHLHFHVFPRLEDETRLFPAPEPNSFDGFYQPTESEIEDLLRRTS